MSPRTLSQPVLSGQARVKLKSGVTIEGRAVYDKGAVHIVGRVRVVSLVGGESRVSYRPLRRWTLPMSRVHHILWDRE